MPITWARSNATAWKICTTRDCCEFSNWLAEYPFVNRLYPGAIDAVTHVQQWAPTVILSDGDAVFQPRKVDRAGLWRVFDGHVLIYVHKEEELDYVEQLYPARR